MGKPKHAALGFVLILFSASCALTSQAQTTASKTFPNVVKGTVSLKGKGIANVVVVARTANSDPQRRPTYRGITDQEGNYRITNIPSGTFQIDVAAPEFSAGISRMLILSEGETVEDIDFDVYRGGVITGKVTAGDRPLIEQQITCERIDNSGNTSSSMRKQTDDRGVYRIFGLSPGKYRVSVGPARPSNRFNRTFYPAAAEPAKAQPIEVSEGSEAKDIDISVELNEQSPNRYSVTGTILSMNEQPLSGMRLRLQVAEDRGSEPLNSVATSNSDGQFKFEDISPGKYRVVTAALVDENLRTDGSTFSVTDKDVSGLTVKVIRKAGVSGVLVYEGVQKATAVPSFSSLFVNGYVVNEAQEGGRFGESARVSPEGTFHMTGLSSGVTTFSLGAMYGGQLKGVSIARVERDGIVQGRGVEIKGDEEITGVRLVLKYLSGAIRGAVSATNGALPPHTRFVVWLSNRNTGDSTPSSPPLVDARGRFAIEGLADGNYEVNANATVTLADGTLKTFTAKQQVTVHDGTPSEITIPIDLNGNP